jgi:hypothetical protein
MLRNRRILTTSAITVALALLAFWASPYWAMARFSRDAGQGDTKALLAQIDVPRLRTSFARQIVRAYPIDPAVVASLDPAARHAASLVAVAYVDAIIAEHLTPEAIADAIGGGEAAGARLGSVRLPTMQRLGGAWDIFMSSGFTGPVSFVIEVNADQGETYQLGFRFIGGSWRLVSLGLPNSVIERLIEELKARLKAR